ncbi:hypothetical protein Ahy_B03g062662 [Arachis hypogaea]|uniref:MULE transposase domain-containing protein n=1 Tax=Arachis hypogaea TaxID=3818 RepID=A0A444ZV16_ARAHY|nr:hypothetical protein Ahy_B03g062662 [Arachis hypogaea]
MDDSTSDCQLNQGEVDYEFESNEVSETLGRSEFFGCIFEEVWLSYCRSGVLYQTRLGVFFVFDMPLSVVDDQFVSKVGMTFTTLEDARKFYKNYANVAGFSTRVRSTNRKGNEIKNQLITYSREGKWKSKISPTKKTNPTAGCWCLDHFKGCVGSFTPLLSKCKGIQEIFVKNERVKSEIFFELELEEDQSIKLAFWTDVRSRAAFEYFGDVISFDTTYNTNRYNLVCGSFVGVNHHGQSTLLGCSLMKNEEIESFK